MQSTAWGTDPEKGPALMEMGVVHGLSRCPTAAVPDASVDFSSTGIVGAVGGWGPPPYTAPFGFHYVPDDPGGFTKHHPAFHPPGVTDYPSCPPATAAPTGNISSENGYFTHRDPIAPVTWATGTPTVTSISEHSLFPFQPQLHPGDTTIRTTDASSFSPASTHSQLHSPIFTPSPGGKNVSWSASSCASSPLSPCEKGGDDYFGSTITIVAMDDNSSSKSSSVQKTRLQPGSRVIAASPGTSLKQTQTLEEYEASRRVWHNQIGKKYRTKLNEQFENLQIVLQLYDEDDEADTDTESPNIHIKGRTINKAKLLDMARQRLEELMSERKAWQQEKRELLENLGMSEE
ncbi:hypothetical protein QBC40DRAFT_290695 [Triangularia verruculosa]|uniref:BHLH domain-containing protein n=1 Tax=Triangularia verruculosa TaxID=2587418 RepID=A0AAN6X7L4_9PEZI|nr:hypothetical protein QBC40DRAFT_290695 [Triangularia verruculosa]